MSNSFVPALLLGTLSGGCLAGCQASASDACPTCTDAGLSDSGVVDGPAAADGSGASDGPARVDGGPLADAEAGIAPTLITCAKLAAMQTLNAGQNYLLDLTGAPTCQLGANTDLVIGGAGTQLTVENGTLEVQGNITLSGNGAFRVSNGTLQIDNQSSFQRNISAGDSSSLVIDHSTVVTNATGMNNFGTNLNASGTASAQFLYSTLPSTNSWLLGVMADSSTLVSQNSTTPNEIYVHDSSNVDIEDDQVPSHPRARNGLWFDFPSGTSAAITLPDQTAPYSWIVGAGQAGYTNIKWVVHIATAQPGIGIEPHAGSSVSVTGQGAMNKEIGFSVNIDPAAGSAIATAMADTPYNFPEPPLNLVSTYSLPLLPGATSSELALQNINIGAFGWQVYVGGGMGSPPVTVNLGAGAFNELGVAPGGHANLNGTTMQLAVLEAIGSGAVLTATNSDIWSQTIQADMQATLNLVGSVVHGGALVATGGGTLQLDNGTELWADGVTTAPNCVFNDDYSWMLAHMGRPLCNPYSNPTMMSSRIHDSGSSINANQTHPACPWSAAGYAPAIDFEMGPAVTSATPGSVSCVPNAGTTVTGSVSAYPYLLSGVQPSTAYACTITAAGSPQSYAVTTSACQY